MQPIYVVLGINLIVWIGIFGYMLATDKKIKDLSAKMDNLEK